MADLYHADRPGKRVPQPEKRAGHASRFHTQENRADGHLFITVLAYQCVQFLRNQLQAAGITGSWSSLRQTLSVQRRVTARLHRKDGVAIHLRKSTVAEPALRAIYQALGISAAPGGTKTLMS